ncbi:ATP-binding protein [Terricaulis sp.]|uniref:sensor histidine kinase n=1 Tax=Terricaulis sp. TaxID=2768686 RepID=UPI003784A5E6
MRVLACVLVQHDPWLVGLAVLICVLCWAGALLVLARVAAAPSRYRRAWLALAGVAAGGGVWATHFIGMLAFDPGVPVAFEVGATMLSLAVGIGGAWLAFEIYEGAKRSTLGVMAAGAVLAAAMAALHFIGMASLTAAATKAWAPDLLAAAVLSSLSGAIAAFGFLSRRRRFDAVVACVCLVAAVQALHYVGMAALTLTPDPRISAPQGFDRDALAGVIAIGTAGMLVAAGVFSFTDRRLVAERLRAAARMHRLANAAFEGIVIHDGERIHEANERMAAILGRTLPELEGHLISEFLSPDARAQVSAALRNERSFPVRTVLIGANGPVEVEMHRRPFSQSQGLFVSAVRDISMQRRAERAEEADSAKSRFMATVSHELRTPLNSIIGYAELIHEETREQSTREDAERVLQAAQHLKILFRDVLDLTKIEAGRIEMNIDACDVGAIVGDVVKTLDLSARERGNTLAVDCVDRDLPFVMADAHRLKQCLVNLVGNAIKFTDGGTITVAMRARDGGVELSVRDDGIGMSAEVMAMLFNPFTQAEASLTRHSGGVGLGLAITQRLMRLMDGDVGVASAMGEGSVFTLWLPLANKAPKLSLAS